MYFSQEQIEQSIKRLGEVHPFFGTVFLALKKIGLAEGETRTLSLTEVLRDFLEEHYRPEPEYPGFYKND